MDNLNWSSGFVQRLEILRAQADLSKAEMARICGLPPRTLENYFKGRKPSVDALVLIARGMDVGVDWLLGDEGDSQSSEIALIEEASWQGAKAWLDTIVQVAQQGEDVVVDGMILGFSSAELAGKFAANISKKYRKLHHHKSSEANSL